MIIATCCYMAIKRNEPGWLFGTLLFGWMDIFTFAAIFHGIPK